MHRVASDDREAGGHSETHIIGGLVIEVVRKSKRQARVPDRIWIYQPERDIQII